ncbi:MAG: flagellar protein [Candidatus Muirbacterium halophilum]|nr:flagellar protein [Candidatus Muirbacterium halophilum]MCK9477154.1 flagellar protein [Candidatus Muirbacterium halophilum]
MRINDLGITSSKLNQNNIQKLKNNKTNFADILNEKLDNKELKVSGHAKIRMQERGIELDEATKNKLESALNKAEEKNAKECLVMTDKAAFIVSVKNRTVITAVDQNSMRGNVFTNIDSAILSF